jgi:AbrB family looped-hinge helix DNA binding protein
MSASTLTRKGQVTIPKPIRDRLKVKEGEKVFFVMRGNEVVLKVLRGTILDLKGSVKASAHPEDFETIRGSVKKAVSARVARHG